MGLSRDQWGSRCSAAGSEDGSQGLEHEVRVPSCWESAEQRKMRSVKLSGAEEDRERERQGDEGHGDAGEGAVAAASQRVPPTNLAASFMAVLLRTRRKRRRTKRKKGKRTRKGARRRQRRQTKSMTRSPRKRRRRKRKRKRKTRKTASSNRKKKRPKRRQATLSKRCAQMLLLISLRLPLRCNRVYSLAGAFAVPLACRFLIHLLP